jgi:hypothetical protein
MKGYVMGRKTKEVKKDKWLKIRVTEKVYNDFKEVVNSEDNNNMSKDLTSHIRKRIKEYKISKGLL